MHIFVHLINLTPSHFESNFYEFLNNDLTLKVGEFTQAQFIYNNEQHAWRADSSELICV